MIVVTFIIMEKRRRERLAAEGLAAKECADDDVAEGGCEGGGSG